MAVDVTIYYVPRGAQDGYEVRERIISDMGIAKIDGVSIGRAQWIGGGADSDGVFDSTFEAKNVQDAEVSAGVIATSLLRQGFSVVPGGENSKLRVTSSEDRSLPDAEGDAFIVVVAPLGT